MALTLPVILLNWNGIDDTIECVESLLNQIQVTPLIYIGDNASSNNEGIELEKIFADEPSVKVVLFETNHGFANGCNLLMEMALNELPSADSVALLNNDAIAEPNWLSQLHTTLIKTQSGMVGSKLISYQDRSILDNVGHRMLSSGEVIPIGNKADSSLYTQREQNFGSCAGAVLYSRKMIEKIGMFDNYFHTGYEDAEFGIRAIVAGYKSTYCPEAIVYHKVSQSVSKIFDINYLTTIQKSIYYSYLKDTPRGLMVLTLPGLIFKVIAMSILNLITNQRHRNQIHFNALKQVWNDRELLKEKRKDFFDEVKPISSFKIRRMQNNWLTFDAVRFYKFYIKGEKSELDKVN